MSAYGRNLHRRGRNVLAAGLAAVLATAYGAAPQPAAAQTGYFAGKTIELIVPYAPGGGADRFGRAIAANLGKYLEGQPTVQVLNVPGADTLTGMNQFAKTRAEARDGTTLALTAISGIIPWALDQEGVDYDLTTFEPLLGYSSSRMFYASKAAGVNTPADLNALAEPLTLPMETGAGSDVLTILALESLGLADGQIQLIFGYDGSAAKRLAVESGETTMGDTSVDTFLSFLGELYRAGDLVPVMTYGVPDGEGGLARDPILPEVPNIYDAHVALYGSPPSGEKWEAYNALLSLVTPFFYGIYTHVEAPDAAKAELRAAMAKVAADPEFAKVVGIDGVLPNKVYVGDDALQFGETLRTTDPETLAWMRAFMAEKYGVK